MINKHKSDASIWCITLESSIMIIELSLTLIEVMFISQASVTIVT